MVLDFWGIVRAPARATAAAVAAPSLRTACQQGLSTCLDAFQSAALASCWLQAQDNDHPHQSSSDDSDTGSDSDPDSSDNDETAPSRGYAEAPRPTRPTVDAKSRHFAAGRYTRHDRGVAWDGVNTPCEFPFVEVREPSSRPYSHNAYVQEDWETMRDAPWEEINVPPRTSPWQHAPELLPRCHLRECDYPASPRHIFCHECPRTGPWARIQKFSKLLLQLLADHEAAAKKGTPWRWDIKGFEELGGKAGLFIHANQIKREYRPYVWDLRPWLRGERAPIRPLQHVEDPQLRCSWNLRSLCAEMLRRDYPDAQHFQEMYITGTHDRTHGPRHTWLCLPYSALLEPSNLALFQKTMQAKRVAQPPKLSSFFPCVMFVPCQMSPKGMAERWHDGKNRCVSDMGGERSRGEDGLPGWSPAKRGTPSPVSINGRTDLTNAKKFPRANWMCLFVMGRQIMILITVKLFCPGGALPPGLHVDQWKTDLVWCYEQQPRCSVNDHQQLQCSSSRGIEIDTQWIFGGCGCVNSASRTETGVCFCLIRRMREACAALLVRSLTSLGLDYRQPLAWIGCSHYKPEFERLLPPPPGPDATPTPGYTDCGCISEDCLLPLLAWSRHRFNLGQRVDWFVLGGLIDDTACYKFHCLRPVADFVLPQFFAEHNIVVADGSADVHGAVGPVGALKKNKTEHHRMDSPMAIVGLQPDLLAGRHGVDPDKQRRFAKATREVHAHVDAHKAAYGAAWAPVQSVQREIGQLQNIATFVCPEIRASLSATASFFPTSDVKDGLEHADVCPVPKFAQEQLEAIGARAFAAQGACLFPRRGALGKGDRRLLWAFFDVSGDKDEKNKNEGKYRGWCVWLWLEGTDVILFIQAPLSRNARRTLDSTALELFTSNEALLLGAQMADHFTADIVSPGDNLSADYVATFGSARSPPNRALLQQRWLLRDNQATNALVVVPHVKRDRNAEADWGTHNELPSGPAAVLPPKLSFLFRARFHTTMRVFALPPAPGWEDRLTAALRAQDKPQAPPLAVPAPPRWSAPAGRWQEHRGA